MSLILEALRKSEAERRRGQAPGLFVEQIPVTAARRARTPAWAWALGLLLLGVIAAWAWRELRRDTAEGTAPTQAVVSDAPAANPPQAPMAPQAETTTAQPSTDNSTPAAAQAPEPTTNHPLPDTARAPGPPIADTQRRAAPTPPLIGTPAVSPPVPAAVETPAPDAPMLASPSPRAPAMPKETTPEPTAEPLPRLAELPASDRAQLPPLKLSMHVYAEDPAQRFVILDGQRLHEGARPAAGLVLEQIRRDGLVLSVNGQRVLLARP